MTNHLAPALPNPDDHAPAIGGNSPSAMVNINGYLFPPGTVLPEVREQLVKYDYPAQASATQRMTLRNQQNIAAGLHPTGYKLREPAGETCKTCAHCVRNTFHNKPYTKCGLDRANWTHGPGSDIRQKWPACSRWSAKAESIGKGDSLKVTLPPVDSARLGEGGIS